MLTNGLNLPERQTIIGVPDFWARVRAAPQRLLAVDYDGTLAPFRVERARATPHAGINEALRQIRDLQTTTLAILSGRPAGQILELTGRDLKIPIYGAHGWEVVNADGTEYSFPLSKTQDEGLTKAIGLAADAGYEEQLERKTASVALHTRGLNHSLVIEERFRDLWQPLTDPHDLLLLMFDHGVELRAQGRDKGVALAELQQRASPETLTVYIGDDATDEDAFRYVKPFGIGIKVGTAGETEAAGRVPDPAAVLQLLRDWPEITRTPQSAERSL